VRTETDFTARNEAFVKTVDEVATAALALPAGDVAATDDMAKQIDDLRITTGENVNFSRGVRLDGGSFGSYLHFDGKRAALVQVEGAADADLLKGVCQHIVFHDPHGISEDDVPAETIDRIRSEAIAAAKESGKPEQIAGKIADGKVRKFLEENTLLHQKYVLDDSKTVREILPGGVTITRFVRYTLGG
jgi:elongation factor Ts